MKTVGAHAQPCTAPAITVQLLFSTIVSGVMSCFQDLVPIAQQGTARVQVTDLSGSDQVNPNPAVFEESGMLVELYLSPEKLKYFSGIEDLSLITCLEICVDTRENTLGNFGAYLPKLIQLKMNNSMIKSVRDLGTTLSHLQVLWMSRCSLSDLDGIPSFSSLKELYVAYNNVSDLSQVSMLEALQLLDLEGNDVDDLVQVQYLGLCSQLHTLTLEGNPVCVRPHPNANQSEGEEGYCYRSAVRDLVPQLRYLDDLCAKEAGPSFSSTMGEDWALLRRSIKDGCSAETAEEERRKCAFSRPASSQRTSSSLSGSCSSSRPASARPLSAAGSRLFLGPRPLSAAGSRTLSPPESRTGFAEGDQGSVDPGASVLTHGAGKILFCGNPVQALRARRQKMRSGAPSPVSTPSDPLHVPEHTYDLEEQDGRHRSEVFAELRAWREHHHKRLLAMERDGPQILTIFHSDEEDDDGNEGSLSVFSGEEEEVDKDSDRSTHWLNTCSPESSIQSPSPGVFQREVQSPEVANPSLSPDSTLSPSPPQSATSGHGSQRPSDLRARRLKAIGRVAGTGPGAMAVLRPAKDPTVPGSTIGDPGFGNLELREAVRLRVPLLPQAMLHRPHRPASSPLFRGLSSLAGQDSVQSVHEHQSLISCRPPETPAVLRPRTARAVLQKTPQPLTNQPNRGDSH
ncbi:leucine-rich repeat-containing protein 56 isoform X1 [Esox lucius]|uniref:Leucine rich repeat containing 56 n=2 Tax=Esox lucius TaxID=8010 RepID=A0AAY5K824_ESOLU|nr:leucine-rich repeat-containing protein 56 isoform X1 [Esox lucius]